MLLHQSSAAPSWVSLSLSLSACVSFLASNVAAAPFIRADLRALLTDPAREWSEGTTVAFPGSSEFEDATERWTIFRPPTYSAAIRPGTEEDIGKVIQLATSHSIPFLVRGAGHSYTTTIGDMQDGLDVDLSQLKSLELDAEAGTVTIGPGVTMAEVFDPLYEAGFEIQTGSCSCPALIGVTLGGGVGRMQGVHGLVIDSLISARVVTAQGEAVEVSEDENPELFWGLRGAGANFGVVTQATYQLHPLTNGGSVYNVEFLIPAEMASSYFAAVETFNDGMPNELAGISIIGFNATTNKTQVSAGWSYFGPEEEGRQALAPIFALNATVTFTGTIPWNRLTAEAGGGIDQAVCQGRTIRDLYSLNLRTYAAATYDEAFAKMERFFAAHPGGRNSVVSFEFFPSGAMGEVAVDTMAFPWRETNGYVNPTFIWAPGDDATAEAAGNLGQELRRDFVATSGYDDTVVFVNYARGDETLEQIYGRDKLPRLAQLKKTWDPEGIFSFHHALPTEYP